jgi:Glycosyl transferase family 2
MSTAPAAAAVAHHAIVLVALHPHVVRTVIDVHVHAVRTMVRGVRALSAALLSRKPKVSVVTPTWRRRDLLLNRCKPSIAAQTYGGEIEHIVVSDGPDPMLDGVPGVRFLPRHEILPNRGVLARLTGTRLATGDVIAYLDDDNSWRPRHLEVLVDALYSRDVAFTYSQALCRNEGGATWIVGCNRPVFAQIDTSLIVHRACLLNVATWEPSGQPADWHLVERWLAAGATWAHVPEITLDYYSHPVQV